MYIPNYLLKQIKELEAKEHKTKTELERLAYINYTLASESDGKIGKIAECFSCVEKSKKTKASAQNRTDVFIRFYNGKKIVNKGAERKTNGGRIQSSIDKLNKGKDEFFIYSLAICNSSTGNSNREVKPIICKFSQFYKMLLEVGAIKSTNGTNPETAIQSSSKAMYLRLLDYPIQYDANAVYCDDDFEGIEL